MKKRKGRPDSSVRISRDTEAKSWASDARVRARMQRQKTRDTRPELALRRLLHARGLRYRVDTQPLPGLRRRADLVFGPARVAVFVDGCFWHGCPEHGQRPTIANTTYWREKVERNNRRDTETDEALVASGWLPIRVWEHENPEIVANLVEAQVRRRRHRSASG
ncbi:very short patch repair endonuclease [Mycolicibacterium septicum]|uniref:very short patch repair endonuclease n=1 Tax=Mycolicibacterium septicum TaxID=98668 RepID=UPI002360EB4D|nr:very short patch repair endonuclease [Mycolicibacterium septicum]